MPELRLCLSRLRRRYRLPVFEFLFTRIYCSVVLFVLDILAISGFLRIDIG